MSSITASSIPRFSISTSSPNTAPNQFGFTVPNSSESSSNTRPTRAASSTVPGTTQQTQLQTATVQQFHHQQPQQQQQQPTKFQSNQTQHCSSQQQQQPDNNSRLPITDVKRKCHTNYSSATITKSRSQSKLIQSNSSHLVYRHTDRAALNPELFTQISRSTFDLQSDNTKQNIQPSARQRIHSQIHVQTSLFEELRQAQSFTNNHQQSSVQEYHHHDLHRQVQQHRQVTSLQDFEADLCATVGDSSVDRLDRLNMSNYGERCSIVMDNDINPSINGNAVDAIADEGIRNDRTDQLTKETGFGVAAGRADAAALSNTTNTPNLTEMTPNGLSYANQDDFMFEPRHKPRLSNISESPASRLCLPRKSTENIHNNNNNNNINNHNNKDDNNINNNNRRTTMTTVESNNRHNSSVVNEKPQPSPLPSPLPLLSFLSSKNEHENVILTIPNDNDIDNDCPTGHCSSVNPFMIVSLDDRDNHDNCSTLTSAQDKPTYNESFSTASNNNAILEANGSLIPSTQNPTDDCSKLQNIQKQSISKYNSGQTPGTVLSRNITPSGNLNTAKNNGNISNSVGNLKKKTTPIITSKQTSMSIQQRSSTVLKTGTMRMPTNPPGRTVSNNVTTKSSGVERPSSITKAATRMPTVSALGKNRTTNTAKPNSRSSTPASESDCLSLVSNASTASTTNGGRARKTMSGLQTKTANNRNAHSTMISNSNRVSTFPNPSSTGPITCSGLKNSETYVKLSNNANGPSSLSSAPNDTATNRNKTNTTIAGRRTSAITNSANKPSIRPSGTTFTAPNRNKDLTLNNTQISNMTSALKVPGTTKTVPATKSSNAVFSAVSNALQRTTNNTRPSSVASNASSSTNATSLASTKSLSKAGQKQPLTKNVPTSGRPVLDRRTPLKNISVPARTTPVFSKELVERLKTNVEALKIELDQWKKRQRDSAQNYEASIVIIKHLVNEYSPFETPNLRTEFARANEQYRSIKQEFELSKELSNQRIGDLERDLRAKEELLALKENEAEERLTQEQSRRELAETKLIALENASKTPNKKFVELKERITNYQKEVESLNVVVELKIQRIKELDADKMRLECDLQHYEVLKESFKNVQRENESFKETLALKARKNAEQLRELDNLRSELKREKQIQMEESIRADQYKYQLDETREQLAKASPDGSDKDYAFTTPMTSSKILALGSTSTPAIVNKPRSNVSRCLFGDDQFEEL